MATSKFSKQADHGFDKGAEYNISAAKHITTRESSRFGKAAAPEKAETADTFRGFKVAKKEQQTRQPDTAPHNEPVHNDISERAIHGKLGSAPAEGFAEGAERENAPKRFTAKSELLHTTEDRAEFITRKQQVFVAANSDKFKSSEPPKTLPPESAPEFTDDKTKQFVYKGAKQKSDAVISRADSALAGVNSVIAAGRQAANELREYQDRQDDAYAREVEDRAKQGANFAFRSTQSITRFAKKTAQKTVEAAETIESAERVRFALSSNAVTKMRFGGSTLRFKGGMSKKFGEEAGKLAVQNMQKAKIVKAVGAATAKAGTGVAVKAGAGAATGGVGTVALLAVDILGSGAKNLAGAIVGEENKSSMNVVMIISAVFLFMAPIVIIVMLIGAALTPFSYIYEFIDGIWTKKAVTYPYQAIQVYIDIEREVIGSTNSTINKYLSGGGANAMNTIDPELWENGGSDAFKQWQSEEFERNLRGEYTEFDYSSYQKAYPDYPRYENGYPITVAPDGVSYNSDGGSTPSFPPKYMGAIWYGTTSDGGFTFTPEGKTDAYGVPEDKLVEFLTTHCVDRAMKQVETDLMPNDFREAYAGYDLWNFSSWQETQSCEGCVGYTYWTEVTHTGTRDDGSTYEYTTTERVEATMCPGHIWDVLDLQLDSDPVKTVTSEFFNVNNVQKELWTYNSELDEDKDGVDDNGNTKSTLKEAQKAYKDTLKEINKMLAEAAKAK